MSKFFLGMTACAALFQQLDVALVWGSFATISWALSLPSFGAEESLGKGGRHD